MKCTVAFIFILVLHDRGAELIGELMQKQIRQQEEQEKDVLEKIKMKMDRIKATHQKGRPKEIRNHFDGKFCVLRINQSLNVFKLISMRREMLQKLWIYLSC
jgi:hypothetical protein